MSQRHLLGTGVLNWSRSERVSDRYGTIFLATDPMLDPTNGNMGEYIKCNTEHFIEVHGRLLVVIKVARQSPHIGDFFRGLCPPDKPLPVGSELMLGKGKLFEEQQEEIPAIGLHPIMPRDNDWLDPEKLYQCHNQTVELYFVPTIEQPTSPA